MNWTVRWEDEAAEDLAHLACRDPKRAANIIQRVVDFAEQGRGDIKKLAARQDEWRLRVGSWRVIFTFNRAERELLELSVETRGRAYRD